MNLKRSFKGAMVDHATPRTIRVLNSTRGTVLGDRIGVADRALSRFIGLLGTLSLSPGGGLLIYPSQGVHTIGMAFPIDVIFLDRNYRVVQLRECLKPFRMTALNWHAASVLELPVSSIQNSLTRIHDQLVIDTEAPSA
ncbi:MAG: DUF192 domain-containing protein [Candidatus Angelobacter sp.]